MVTPFTEPIGLSFKVLAGQIHRQILTLQKATSTRPFHGKSASKRQSPPSSSIEDSSALTAWSCCKPPSAKSLLIGPLATHIAAMSQVCTEPCLDKSTPAGGVPSVLLASGLARWSQGWRHAGSKSLISAYLMGAACLPFLYLCQQRLAGRTESA